MTQTYCEFWQINSVELNICVFFSQNIKYFFETSENENEIYTTV